jgi:replicative DNA helicase
MTLLDRPLAAESQDLAAPPHSNDAEEAVLGSVLKDPAVMAEIITVVRPSDFYGTRHRHIFQAAVNLFDRSQVVDLHTLAEELTRTNTYEASGGVIYLSEINIATPSAAHAVHYARIVRDHAVRRNTISAASTIAEMAYAARLDMPDLAARSEAALATAFEQIEDRAHFWTSPEWVELLENMDAQGDGEVIGIDTGLKDLNRATLGLCPKSIYLIAGGPGEGKSAFCHQIGLWHSLHGGHVLMFSLENTIEQLAQRAVAMWADVDLGKLKLGKLSMEENQRVARIMERLAQGRFTVKDDGGLSALDIRAMTKQYIAKAGPITLMIVDYIQIMGGQKEKKHELIGDNLMALKNLAKELGIPILVAAQLSRAREGRGNKLPQLSDLRESGDLENHSDVVLALHREEKWNPDTVKRGITDVLMLKNRESHEWGHAGTGLQFLFAHRYKLLEAYVHETEDKKGGWKTP